jgi:hypothetical protein
MKFFITALLCCLLFSMSRALVIATSKVARKFTMASKLFSTKGYCGFGLIATILNIGSLILLVVVSLS